MFLFLSSQDLESGMNAEACKSIFYGLRDPGDKSDKLYKDSRRQGGGDQDTGAHLRFRYNHTESVNNGVSTADFERFLKLQIKDPTRRENLKRSYQQGILHAAFAYFSGAGVVRQLTKDYHQCIKVIHSIDLDVYTSDQDVLTVDVKFSQFFVARLTGNGSPERLYNIPGTLLVRYHLENDGLRLQQVVVDNNLLKRVVLENNITVTPKNCSEAQREVDEVADTIYKLRLFCKHLNSPVGAEHAGAQQLLGEIIGLRGSLEDRAEDYIRTTAALNAAIESANTLFSRHEAIRQGMLKSFDNADRYEVALSNSLFDLELFCESIQRKDEDDYNAGLELHRYLQTQKRELFRNLRVDPSKCRTNIENMQRRLSDADQRFRKYTGWRQIFKNLMKGLGQWIRGRGWTPTLFKKKKEITVLQQQIGRMMPREQPQEVQPAIETPSSPVAVVTI